MGRRIVREVPSTALKRKAEQYVSLAGIRLAFGHDVLPRNGRLRKSLFLKNEEFACRSGSQGARPFPDLARGAEELARQVGLLMRLREYNVGENLLLLSMGSHETVAQSGRACSHSLRGRKPNS